MAENKPFKFSDNDKNNLLDSWRRKSDRAIATKYIDKVEKLVEQCFYNPPLPLFVEEKTPQQERDNRKKVLDLSRQLRGVLSTQSAQSRYRINVYDMANEDEHFSDIFLDRLINNLEMLEASIKPWLKSKTPSTDRKGDSTRRDFMFYLIYWYIDCFGKEPSTSPAGNFRTFLRTLSSIIDIPLGEDLLKRELQKKIKLFFNM